MLATDDLTAARLAMAKKKARKAAASGTRKTKTSAHRKRAATKPRRKAAPPKQAKSAARKNTAKPAGRPSAKPPETLAHKIAGAFKAVVDTLADAEQLHHRLDPDASQDIAPE
jgi:hypothetical protein